MPVQKVSALAEKTTQNSNVHTVRTSCAHAQSGAPSKEGTGFKFCCYSVPHLAVWWYVGTRSKARYSLSTELIS